MIPYELLWNLTQTLMVAFKVLHDPLLSYFPNLISHYVLDT